ncbi:hypothetical protein ACJD0Z_08385 [Flavobacteriaceae bacterium M23B6Z8]
MKQNTIIVAQGTANVGKSMTLSRLGRQLITAGATTVDDVTKTDYSARLQYSSVTIGIQTYGDLEGWVAQGLQHFLNNSCDIIAIASKRYGATARVIEEFASVNNYRVIWSTPYRVWDGSITDSDIKDYSASHLKLMVDDIISGSI